MQAEQNSNVSDWEFDLRVRERLLASGSLDQARLEQHLSELPDLESEAVAIDIPQPSLSMTREASSSLVGVEAQSEQDDSDHETASV